MKRLYVLAVLVLGIVADLVLKNFIPPDIALFIGFIVIVGGLIILDRKQVKLEGIIIMRRTKKGRDFIDRVASAAPRAWRLAGNIGIVLGVIVMILGSLLLASQAYLVASGATDGGVKLLLPGPVSSPVNAPGVFVVPWWIWVIGIAVVIVPHEFMHGIMCRIDRVRIKSVGWVLLAVIPGAFVEPDEKQLKKQSKGTKLRVFAAGSFANLVTAAIILGIMILFVTPMLAPAGVAVVNIENGPAYNASVNGSIMSIDGQRVATRDDVTAILAQHNPGDTVTVQTASTKYIVPAFSAGPDVLSPKPVAIIDGSGTSTYTVQLGKNPDTGAAYLGIYVAAQAATLSMDPGTFAAISTLLLWMFVFSFGIGIVNMLPIGPLDGGQFFGELAGGRKKLARVVTAVMLALLLFNIIGPLFLAG